MYWVRVNILKAIIFLTILLWVGVIFTQFTRCVQKESELSSTVVCAKIMLQQVVLTSGNLRKHHPIFHFFLPLLWFSLWSSHYDVWNRHLTVHEIAKELGISVDFCHEILTEKPEMHRISAKFLPRLLSDDEKENHFNISQELFDRASADENFIKNVITWNESWMYGYDVETNSLLSLRSGWERVGSS